MKLRLSGHETFYPREHWLYKGIQENKLKYESNFFKENESYEYLSDYMGVGINMVKSIRYWVSAFGLIVKKENTNANSEILNELLDEDPYLDKLHTSWILHYNLVTNENFPTTWHWFFCHSDLASFNKEIFIRNYKEWLDKNINNQKYSERSIENDFQTLVGMYSMDEKNKDLFYPSQFINCGILKYNTHLKRYVRTNNPSVDIHVLLYLFLIFKERFFKDTASIDLDVIKNIPESPLRALKIDVDNFFELSEKMSKSISKKVKLTRTAGIKTISFSNTNRKELLKEIYKQEGKFDLF